MTNETKPQVVMRPLTGICPSWEGNYIESVYQDLLSGLEIENKRLAGCKFLVVGTTQELCIDGIYRFIDVLEGFTNEQSAREYIEKVFQDRSEMILKRVTLGGDYYWSIKANDTDISDLSVVENEQVNRILLRCFYAFDGSGFHHQRMELDLFEIHSTSPLEPALLSYYEDESLWKRWLIDKGEDARGALVSA